MKHRKLISLVGAAILAVGQLGSSQAWAEARYDRAGFTIDAEVWIEDAEIDPISYFVHSSGNKRMAWGTEHDVFEFFDIFNALVRQGTFNDLDVRIVWGMRFAPTNADMIYDLGINRNTYFARLQKIRREMRDAYEFL